MQSKSKVELDYTYFNERVPEIKQLVRTYFGEENVRINSEVYPSYPERPERRNSVGANWLITLYDTFEVGIVANVSAFFIKIYLFENPKGYKRKENASIFTPISIAALVGKGREYDNYTYLSFHPTDENILIFFKLLDDFLKYLLEEKVKQPELTYTELAYMHVCKIKGRDYQSYFLDDFEPIKR